MSAVELCAFSIIGGSGMETINLPFFYQFGSVLRPLTALKTDKEYRMEVSKQAIQVQPHLNTLLRTYPLQVCRGLGQELDSAIDDALRWLFNVKVEEINKEDYTVDTKFSTIVNRAKEFETVFLAEVQRLASYYVEKKGAYAPDDLIERAENVLPNTTKEKLGDEAIEEIRQSGRCLGFDVATASGFHIMRATESVMHEYYLVVCKPRPKPKGRLDNWGAYIAALNKVNNADVKEVVAMLQQIKDRHRNLIMHPEVVLTPDEAHTLFEIAKSAIISMADRLPKPKEPKAKTNGSQKVA